MVNRCRIHVNAFKSTLPVEVVQGDILDVDINDASMVVLNFTLQFIAPELRQSLLNKICAGLRPGGVLVLSEKIRAEDTINDDILVDLHHHFKRVNGYSELEISQKRTALENVMKPATLTHHHNALSQAGFAHSQVWYQCFNFCSMVAIKA